MSNIRTDPLCKLWQENAVIHSNRRLEPFGKETFLFVYLYNYCTSMLSDGNHQGPNIALRRRVAKAEEFKPRLVFRSSLHWQTLSLWYCGWKKSCTSWYMVYFFRDSTILLVVQDFFHPRYDWKRMRDVALWGCRIVYLCPGHALFQITAYYLYYIQKKMENNFRHMIFILILIILIPKFSNSKLQYWFLLFRINLDV